MSERTETLRQTLGEVMDEATTRDRMRQIVHDALDSEHSRKVECPECGTLFRAKMPDLKKQLDSVIALLEQKEGKAAQQVPEATQIIIRRPALPK